ncbi:hypothetical protein A4A49_53504 [Nicotiana attenuata]|uniref:Uncharacterized protein n=1 Tax=Nicotiana attenuata TaxID=49451 RepID=A0A1J6KBK4_NICAT|nr:hypothetical protein A4A49_53504 [Nicotiana attenuata]
MNLAKTCGTWKRLCYVAGKVSITFSACWIIAVYVLKGSNGKILHLSKLQGQI